MIRKAILKDSEAIAREYIGFENELTKHFPVFFSNYRKPETMKSLGSIKKEIEKMIKDKNGLFLVVEKANKICGIGYVTAKKDKRIVYPGVMAGEVKELWLKEEVRGHGISSKMKDIFMAWFKEKKCELVRIEVLSANPASKIYANWGFTSYVETFAKKI